MKSMSEDRVVKRSNRHENAQDIPRRRLGKEKVLQGGPFCPKKW